MVCENRYKKGKLYKSVFKTWNLEPGTSTKLTIFNKPLITN